MVVLFLKNNGRNKQSQCYMVLGTSWIDFSSKPHISAVSGRPLPEDFPIILAEYTDNSIHYTICSAIIATRKYQEGDHSLIAWRAFEQYHAHTPRLI